MRKFLKTNDFSKRRSRRAVAGWVILLLFVLIAVFADFLAPYEYSEQRRNELWAPSSSISFTGLRPVVHPRSLDDPLRLTYVDDRSQAFPVRFFVQGDSYRLLGLLETNRHLFGVEPGASATRINLLGTDALGRDRFSRLLHAMRFSLVVCALGVALACTIGIVIGVISAYSGRVVDTVLMGTTDAMFALPTLILILAARAAFPMELPPWRAAFLMLLIFALTGWAEIARLTRGLVLSMREREFVMAAVATGLTQTRILLRHVLPNISAPLIRQAVLLLASFLLAEIALSYFGVGVQEPEPSLGNMLTAAADLNQLRSNTINVLSPAIAVFAFTLAVRLVGQED